ncbi:MAG TPA: HsdR family type I site-specific deoxyribonuclease [Cyclobacteriaceae bacterium]|nr:HsdR family type I site-specific deoxyribonuclease [Cyclobacteriaceae bacterium]HMV08168.1 HsdR family type I site-specific deoxyribonuclease [Cyclobacteriaceae bacterium]HMX00809.1 HsdR family type I site-specific deoxyribonuclease [Cyclobacteriaceae bacterium]HMX49316.1 HsdR family type I site-specific deoxyribonuclease [Cyclobacteriaceae bacterium]HMY93612.1 HsdR family type I site-specific deoxyribonuclease [Cyclobacteriaceae bacterium]
MNDVGQIERKTQQRIVKLFHDTLDYTYLGNWEERPNNSNIEEELLRTYLIERKYNPVLINKAIAELKRVSVNYQLDLYTNNKNVYSKLRYGIEVKEDAGDRNERVHLIDWKHPEKNHFAIAEEVTVQGERDKRPDIVLYVNGIALAVLELKRSTISIADGIRQSIVNQQREFIEQFFTTIQFVFAGNDTEGLRYGTIGTIEKYFLNWKEDEESNAHYKLDKYLIKLCNKERFLEIIYDFIVFDGGVKKLPRPHQYFGIREAQLYAKRKEGGIIWHTQGSGKSIVMVSGKSIVMVLFAKWILENNSKARVAIVTDREELDKQIKRVFEDAGEEIHRTRSGKDLLKQLNQAKPRLLCSLVHKFGRKDVEDFDEFIRELEANPVKTKGEIFVFVDECHRTQSGKLHKTMKKMLGDSIFVGFTGTPLLKKDRQTTLEVFGKYIHTYKFNEAVDDGVVLDLVYEARDIDQKVSSPGRVDAWFESKTRGLNDFQKSALKQKWGTMQRVLSSKNRMDRIVNDIVLDFNTKPRLNSETGNAILVAGSIYEACKYFELFQRTELGEKCAIITSYNPSLKNVVTEDTGESTETDKEFIQRVYDSVLKAYTMDHETYADKAKEAFIKTPAKMKLLIVRDKLLTGFDAPSCTYLYIDKNMQDHGLFQAICRVNRLDGDEKQFGYIVDYKNLFESVKGAISVYTSELDYDTFNKEDCEVLLQSRLENGRERLDGALEEISLLCEPVLPPKGTLEHIHYFCGNTEIQEDLKATEVRRTALYKATVNLIRAYANIVESMPEAGYSEQSILFIKGRIDHYLKLREEIRRASGEVLDLKTYEADMRHLIDNYIQADDPRIISPFGDIPLLDLILKFGIEEAIDKLPEDIRTNKEAVAETIENNVRQKIIREHLIDPAFFEEMSKLLKEIISQRKSAAINYEEYLKKISEVFAKVNRGTREETPESIKTPAQKVLYNNLGKDAALAMEIHDKIIEVKPDSWKGNELKERVVKSGLYEILRDEAEVERIFEIVKQQPEY